jgi:hypothetical protein
MKSAVTIALLLIATSGIGILAFENHQELQRSKAARTIQCEAQVQDFLYNQWDQGKMTLSDKQAVHDLKMNECLKAAK